MCARYTMVTPADELIEEFEATLVGAPFSPQYNIAPTDLAPIVFQTKEGERRLGPARFGLIPHWAKQARDGVKMLNARVETVATRSAYRRAFQRHRCLVVADGFYEWERRGKEKLPHRYHLGGGPFAFAGLWAIWNAPDGEKVSSFTILTRPAVGVVSTIHQRMPIIVPRTAYAPWLDRQVQAPDVVLSLLESHRGESLLDTRVSTRVNSVKNDDPTLIEPIP